MVQVQLSSINNCIFCSIHYRTAFSDVETVVIFLVANFHLMRVFSINFKIRRNKLFTLVNIGQCLNSYVKNNTLIKLRYTLDGYFQKGLGAQALETFRFKDET